MKKRELLEIIDSLLSRADLDDEIIFVKSAVSRGENSTIKSEVYYRGIQPHKIELINYEAKTEEGKYPVEWALELI